MDVFGGLRKLLGIDGAQQPQSKPRPVNKPVTAQATPGRTNYGVPEDSMWDTPNGYKTPQQMTQAPTRMFEDSTWQGDVNQLKQQYPGYTFYEDATFSAPKYVEPQFKAPSFESVLRRRRF